MGKSRALAPIASLLCFVIGCTGPWIGPTAGMGWRWKSEPLVGASTPALDQPVSYALERWGYGRRAIDCRGADVCVIFGQRNHAGPIGTRCIAEVDTELWYVSAHELGHCFGIPHSTDPLSVMFEYSREGQDVLDADRLELRRMPL